MPPPLQQTVRRVPQLQLWSHMRWKYQANHEETHPVSFNWPPLMPTFESLSRGDQKGINCRSFLSRKSRFVVSSKRFVIWSTASGVPYFEFFSVSGELVRTAHGSTSNYELPWRNAFARRLTNTDPENTPKIQMRILAQERRDEAADVQSGGAISSITSGAVPRIAYELISKVPPPASATRNPCVEGF